MSKVVLSKGAEFGNITLPKLFKELS